MDRYTADAITQDVNAAIAGVLAKHGMERTRTRGKYGDAELTMTITLAEKAPDGEVVNPNSTAAKAFVRYAEGAGLDPELLGKKVRTTNGQVFTVTGWNTRAPKNAILLQGEDGRTYHCPRGTLKSATVVPDYS
jgi:hypothetical protein